MKYKYMNNVMEKHGHAAVGGPGGAHVTDGSHPQTKKELFSPQQGQIR